MHTKPKFLQHDKRIMEWAPLMPALLAGCHHRSPQHLQELIGRNACWSPGKELTKVSSPAQSPQYTMTIPAGTRCVRKGNGIVVADILKVIGGNDHDLQHYHIWIYESEVEEVDDAVEVS